MKKVLLLVITLFLSLFISYAQDFKIINKSVEIVKSVGAFIDESGKEYIFNDSDTFLHIKVDSFGEAGNIVSYWLEQDGKKYNSHLVEDALVLSIKKNGIKGYMLMNEDFIYMYACESENYDFWLASFQTKERED